MLYALYIYLSTCISTKHLENIDLTVYMCNFKKKCKFISENVYMCTFLKMCKIFEKIANSFLKMCRYVIFEKIVSFLNGRAWWLRFLPLMVTKFYHACLSRRLKKFFWATSGEATSGPKEFFLNNCWGTSDKMLSP